MDPNIAIFGAIISFLFTGNLFFIKKIVDNIEKTAVTALEAKNNLVALKIDVNAIGAQLREIKSEIKDFRRIDIEVAVMKAQIAQKQIMEIANDKTMGP